MDTQVKQVLDRAERLGQDRRIWEDHWQDLAEHFLPRRADFTAQQIEGAKRNAKQFDGTPAQAARGLAAAVDGLIKPKTSRWFSIRPVDDDLAEADAVKRWLELVEERMYGALYAPRAKFLQSSNEVDLDLVVFGTGVLFTGLSRDRTSLNFRSLHLKHALVAENSDGEIDTLYWLLFPTARQAAQKWGEKALGRKTREALERSDGEGGGGFGAGAGSDQRFKFIQAVQPREDRDPRRADDRNLPFASTVIDVESEHVVAESGFHEFPFAVPRWDTATGEVYGRSPAMIALPDSATLQQQGKTILKAGHKAVDPPLLAASDSIFGAPLTFPGGVTYFDAEAARELGGRPPIVPLQTGTNFPLGRELQNDSRDQVWAAFFRNVLQLPVGGPQMTAFEVAQRKEEFVRTIGPTFGRLEADYIARVVEVSFALMQRAGAFPEAPDALRGRPVRFEFQSPVEQARRQIDAASLEQWAADMAPFAQSEPGIFDHIDADAAARDIAEIRGMPQKWLRSREQVEELRAARAQAEQAQAVLAQGQAVLEGVGQVADIAGKLQPEMLEMAADGLAGGALPEGLALQGLAPGGAPDSSAAGADAAGAALAALGLAPPDPDAGL